MTLAKDGFIRRFLLHVLPRGQRRIRHYGFYGNGNRAANIARIRRLLGAKAPDRERANDDSTGDTDEPPRVLGLPCPCCGGRLGHHRHNRASTAPQNTANTSQGRSMKCAPCTSKTTPSAACYITCGPIRMRPSMQRLRHSRHSRHTPWRSAHIDQKTANHLLSSPPGTPRSSCEGAEPRHARLTNPHNDN